MSDTLNITPAETSSPKSRFASLQLPLLLMLLAFGALQTYFLLQTTRWSAFEVATQLAILVAAAGIGTIALFIRRLPQRLGVLRNPSEQNRAWTTAIVWLVSMVYLIFAAHQQHRDLFPRIHDECSYTIQTRMLASGRLWLPKHELADFFETFHFLTQPVYGSIYFPGTALMNVPGVWLGQASWFMPVLLAALAVALSYRVAAELVDGLAGLLVSLLILSTELFRVHSTMVMAQIPVMLLGLLMAWAWLRWRRERSSQWAATVGAFAGWAAITRPVDALAFAIPIGLAMAWDLKGNIITRLAGPLGSDELPSGLSLRVEDSRVAGRLFRSGPTTRPPLENKSPNPLLRTAIALLAGALPFLALQGVFDWGVTGNPFKTPYVTYLEQNQPGSVFGSGPAAMGHPTTTLPQKQIYFSELSSMEQSGRMAGVLRWLQGRARLAIMASLPCGAMLLLIPASLLVCRTKGRWAILAAIPVCFALYAFNPFFLMHYAVPLTGAMALAVVLGIRAIEGAIPFAPGRRFAGGFLTSLVVLWCVGSLPQLNRHVTDEPYRTPLLDRVESALATIPAPAVVFFHFTPGGNVHEEPVYNLATANPDDAPIIRAQDLGPRNGELIRYYALRQPDRTFYAMDRRTGRIARLGNPIEAAAILHVPLNLPESATADIR